MRHICFGLRHQISMSYRTILSVVNEHTVSTVIARYAFSMAAACKARLVLYCAHDNGTDEAILQRSQRHLDHLYTVASELGISVTRVSEIGKIDTLLPKRVQADNADLVLYPLTPYKRYGVDRQRHTIHRLLRTIKTDLAIMRIITLTKPHPRQILVPLGGVVDEQGHHLRFVAELAKSFQAQVTLYHLFPKRETKEIPDDISDFRKQLQQQQVAVLERSSRGDIARSITVEAITRHHDLIVLGASRRGLLGRMIYGNPAGDVMHQPPCNTILFRSGP